MKSMLPHDTLSNFCVCAEVEETHSHGAGLVFPACADKSEAEVATRINF